MERIGEGIAEGGKGKEERGDKTKGEKEGEGLRHGCWGMDASDRIFRACRPIHMSRA